MSFSAASAMQRVSSRCGPGEEPLFTDFTASNLGVPGIRLQFYYEGQPDQRATPTLLEHRWSGIHR